MQPSPKGFARVSGVTSVTGSKIVFGSRTHRLELAYILLRPEGPVLPGSPLIVQLRSADWSREYASWYFGAESSTGLIPGFVLPAGGLSVSSNLAAPAATVEVLFHGTP